MEQSDAQARFQLLNKLRHRGFAHMKSLGSLCEATCLYHASKGAHRIETIHSLSSLLTDCLDITNNDGQSRLFIRPILHL
ncbi:hypothetical protein ACRS43_17885 [Enterobacter cloacae]